MEADYEAFVSELQSWLSSAPEEPTPSAKKQSRATCARPANPGKIEELARLMVTWQSPDELTSDIPVPPFFEQFESAEQRVLAIRKAAIRGELPRSMLLLWKRAKDWNYATGYFDLTSTAASRTGVTPVVLTPEGTHVGGIHSIECKQDWKPMLRVLATISSVILVPAEVQDSANADWEMSFLRNDSWLWSKSIQLEGGVDPKDSGRLHPIGCDATELVKVLHESLHESAPSGGFYASGRVALRRAQKRAKRAFRRSAQRAAQMKQAEELRDRHREASEQRRVKYSRWRYKLRIGLSACWAGIEPALFNSVVLVGAALLSLTPFVAWGCRASAPSDEGPSALESSHSSSIIDRQRGVHSPRLRPSGRSGTAGESNRGSRRPSIDVVVEPIDSAR